MTRARTAKELSVHLGNRVGTGAAIFGRLKAGGVNVIASCCYLIDDQAQFTIVPEQPDVAEEALRADGLAVESRDVLLVEMSNEVGALASVLQEISGHQVDVLSAYVTTVSTRSALAVVKTSDDVKVLAALNAGDSDS